jgi:hypothetical protein
MKENQLVAIIFVLIVISLFNFLNNRTAEFVTENFAEPTISDPMTASVILSETEKSLKPKTEKKKEVIPGVDRKYTGYEVAMYYLKAHESFRPWEYEDGKYPSKGFGLNLTPNHVKWASGVLGFPARSKDWTYEQGQLVLREFWQRKFDKSKLDELPDYKRTAMLLHSYNTGKMINIRGCCGSKVGCGRRGGGKNAKIRAAHNKRRDFEWRLYNDKVSQEEITQLRKSAIKVEAEWRKKAK